MTLLLYYLVFASLFFNCHAVYIPWCDNYDCSTVKINPLENVMQSIKNLDKKPENVKGIYIPTYVSIDKSKWSAELGGIKRPFDNENFHQCLCNAGNDDFSNKYVVSYANIGGNRFSDAIFVNTDKETQQHQFIEAITTTGLEDQDRALTRPMKQADLHSDGCLDEQGYQMIMNEMQAAFQVKFNVWYKAKQHHYIVESDTAYQTRFNAIVKSYGGQKSGSANERN